MHSPLSMQEVAHLREASGPSPLRTISRTPAITSCGLTLAMPAGWTLGQMSMHLPHLTQASSISSTRLLSAVSKDMPFISCAPLMPVSLSHRDCVVFNVSPEAYAAPTGPNAATVVTARRGWHLHHDDAVPRA